MLQTTRILLNIASALLHLSAAGPLLYKAVPIATSNDSTSISIATVSTASVDVAATESAQSLQGRASVPVRLL